jgi:hypothetical protein
MTEKETLEVVAAAKDALMTAQNAITESQAVVLQVRSENTALREALEKINSENKVETNPVIRTRDYIHRHNKWLEQADKFGLENGSPLDAEQLKIKMPSYCAAASHKSGPIELEIITR